GKYAIQFTTIVDAAFVSGIEVASSGTIKTNAPLLAQNCTRPMHATLPSGGLVLTSGVEVVHVLWGSGVRLSQASMTNFNTAVATSPYLKWIQAEYGVGAVDFSTAPVPITPSTNLQTVTDADIGNELHSQNLLGKLVPNDVSKIDGYVYLVYFPPGITVQLV